LPWWVSPRPPLWPVRRGAFFCPPPSRAPWHPLCPLLFKPSPWMCWGCCLPYWRTLCWIPPSGRLAGTCVMVYQPCPELRAESCVLHSRAKAERNCGWYSSSCIPCDGWLCNLCLSGPAAKLPWLWCCVCQGQQCDHGCGNTLDTRAESVRPRCSRVPAVPQGCASALLPAGRGWQSCVFLVSGLFCRSCWSPSSQSVGYVPIIPPFARDALGLGPHSALLVRQCRGRTCPGVCYCELSFAGRTRTPCPCSNWRNGACLVVVFPCFSRHPFYPWVTHHHATMPS
jgi:hypothetical protein